MIGSPETATIATRKTATRGPAWQLLLAFSLILILYFDTFASMVRIWRSIDTYTFGFLIFPISIYLIWIDRERLKHLQISGSLVGLWGLAALSLLWWFSNTVGVQVATQFSVVAMITATTLALTGPATTRAIAFPLIFLLFAIPFGEILIPYLIDFTAFFTVEALNLMGIPIYRNGAYFQIPTGSYEVADACSGIRFFIATFAMSTLLSHQFFQGLVKRLMFIAMALALAILANGIRATVVVLTLHYTDLDIAAGQDHAFVGWLIYGVLLLLLLGIGRKYQDEPTDCRPVEKALTRSNGRPIFFVFLVIFAILVGPMLSFAIKSSTSVVQSEDPGIPNVKEGWVTASANTDDWGPTFVGHAGMRTGSFAHDSGRVDLAIVRYLGQRQGAEISNSVNSVVDLKVWRILEAGNIGIDIEWPGSLALQEVVVRNREDGSSRVVWYWIEVNGSPVRGVVNIKQAEVKSLITFKQTRSSAIIASAPITISIAATRQLLQDFFRDYYGSLKQCLGVPVDSDNCISVTVNLENN